MKVDIRFLLLPSSVGSITLQCKLKNKLLGWYLFEDVLLRGTRSSMGGSIVPWLSRLTVVVNEIDGTHML